MRSYSIRLSRQRLHKMPKPGPNILDRYYLDKALTMLSRFVMPCFPFNPSSTQEANRLPRKWCWLQPTQATKKSITSLTARVLEAPQHRMVWQARTMTVKRRNNA